MDTWITYSHQNLSVVLKYPSPTPQGNSVNINEQSTPSSFRAHFVSEGSDEIYFEVGRYSNLSVKQVIADFLKDVTGRIENLKISEVEELTYADSPARHLSIHWPGKERVILFIEKEDALYRIIHDPNSPINIQILDTLEFLKNS